MLALLAAVALLRRRARAEDAPQVYRGELARATVLKLWDTGVTRREQPVVGFVFEVRRRRQAPYQTEVRCAVPRTLIPQVQPGATVPVRVDADNPARVMLALGAAFGAASGSFQSDV